MDASEKNSLEVVGNMDHHLMGDDQVPTNIHSSGQGLNLEIVNQYGQLIGEFSKLDDELWFSPPEDDQFMIACNEDPEINHISSVQHDQVVHLEPTFDHSDISTVRMSSSILKTQSQNQSQNLSPVSVLGKRLYSNFTRKAVKHSRSKLRRSGKEKFFRRSVTQAGQSEYAESLLRDGTLDALSAEQVRTRKLSDLLQPHSVMRNQNFNLETSQQLNLNTEPEKTCMHCKSSRTPQWRNGPMGPKTLCNACGIQFKFGKLSANYHPFRNPTFDPSLHTSFLKSKEKKLSNRNLNYGSSPKRSREMKSMDHSEIYEKDTPNTISTQGILEEIGDLPVSVSRLRPTLSRIKRQRLDDKTRENQYSTRNTNNVQEMKINKVGEMYPKNSLKANSIEDMTEETSEMVEADFILRDKDYRPRNYRPRENLLKKPSKQGHKKCLHCESIKTSQWRNGPMGRNTLCNACGVQYINGRLFPEYRPLKSPTYDPSLHSHLPKKVLEMRMRERIVKSAVSGDSEQPVPS